MKLKYTAGDGTDMNPNVKNSKDLTAREIFEINVNFLRSAYPHRDISIVHSVYGDLVYVDGQIKFNTEGYCLLYNLQRLVECLEGELL